MPNSFGTAALQIPLIDPRLVIRHRARFLRDAIPEIGQANSLYVPSGRWPARGWLLVRRKDYLALNPYSTALQLSIQDFRGGALTFKNLTVVQARCVTRGLVADPDAIYLVEVTDGRGVLWNPWGTFPTTSAYNVRSPAYPEQYYTDSLNAGAVWTWATMAGNLWAQMGTFLGPFPGLPTANSGTPENWWFPGTPAWKALCKTLDRVDCTVSCDLTSATPYGVVAVGAADAAFTALQTAYLGAKEDDYEYIDTGSGRVPGRVVVYFHRRNQYYATEETVRRDGFQWATNPLYSLTVSAPAQFAGAAGTAHLWTDYTVRFDQNGFPLAADVATAAVVAAEEATSYYARIYRGTLGYLRQLYAGVVPFKTGSLVDGVRWRMVDGRRAAWETEIIRGPQPPWEAVKVEERYER